MERHVCPASVVSLVNTPTWPHREKEGLMRRDGGVMASGTLSGKEDNLHFLLKVKQKYIERFGFDNLTVPF